jgi:hypothetical protein
MTPCCFGSYLLWFIDEGQGVGLQNLVPVGVLRVGSSCGGAVVARFGKLCGDISDSPEYPFEMDVDICINKDCSKEYKQAPTVSQCVSQIQTVSSDPAPVAAYIAKPVQRKPDIA